MLYLLKHPFGLIRAEYTILYFYAEFYNNILNERRNWEAFVETSNLNFLKSIAKLKMHMYMLWFKFYPWFKFYFPLF